MLLNITEAVRAINGIYSGNGAYGVRGMFTDTRESFEGGVFFAQIGERVDGHTFVPRLNAAGFPCVVSEPEYAGGENILVKDAERALGDLARYWRENYAPAVKVAAVTGSVGKTTTKDMLGLVFSSSYRTFVPKGNRNSVIGLPMSVSQLENDYDYAVFELGSSSPGEIPYLSDIVRPHISVVTCIGSSHLEFFLTRENIKKEKLGILSGEKTGGHVVLDGDSDILRGDPALKRYSPVWCGFGPDCDYRIVGMTPSPEGTSFTVEYPGGTCFIKIRSHGEHIVKDATYAFAAGMLCGIDARKAALALAEYEPYGDRQRIYEKDGVTVIADCYNASPESMRASLGVLKDRAGRKIAVLGDMRELGQGAPGFHADIAREAARTADILIFVGEYAPLCARECGEKESYAFSADERPEAAAKLKEILRPGDTVLFKGSHSVKLDEIIKEAKL